MFPEGVLNVICGDRNTGAALVSHPIPQMVSITGSVRAGMEVMRAASDDLKNVHLELGGKAPVLVFDASGNLWIGVGDTRAGEVAAPNTNDLRGKILRIKPIAIPDGETPAPGVGTTVPGGPKTLASYTPSRRRRGESNLSLRHRGPPRRFLH